MHPKFSKIIESLHPSLERLLQMTPVTSESLPRQMPKSGIYLFTENGRHLYIGRSNRLKSRIRRHGAPNSKHNVAAFAFKLARRKTGNINATYKHKGSRANLLVDPKFAIAFSEAKAQIQKMELRYVEETDQLKQAVLEIYASVALNTPFNDFDTH